MEFETSVIYYRDKTMATPQRDAAADQLLEYSKEHQLDKKSVTTTYGVPIGQKDASLTVGYHGPILLQDRFLIDELSHFSRERIPERVVHAKGAGAFGTFVVTHDITQYTAASVFEYVGKKTPIAVRFSQVAGEMGYPDTVRDIRGFAIKFYSDDGIWDLVGNNQPVFFVKDCILFPSFIHTMKRNPKTHLRPDYDMFWDFVTLREETIHTAMILFSDRGIPASYRNMHGYGVNTFAFVNNNGKFSYCKFHYLTNQGIANLSSQQAQQIAGIDPDYHTRDLYDAIATGSYPSWKLYIQIMTPEQAQHSPYDPFDDTKVWLHADYPLIPVGEFVLNKNPENYFAEVEQIGFDVAHLIPGIEPSPDRMLQGRLFNYGDTHRYRLGTNNLQLQVNSPFSVRSYTRDGESTIKSQGGAPNYHPNSFNGPDNDVRARRLEPVLPLHEDAKRIDSGQDDNFTQAQLLYNRVMKPEERERLVQNIASWLIPANSVMQERAISLFARVNKDLGDNIKIAIHPNVTHHVDL